MDSTSTMEWIQHLDQSTVYWKEKERYELFLRVRNKSSNLPLEEERHSANVIVEPHIWPICSRMKCCSIMVMIPHEIN
jgi:hypothetical protein